MATIFGNKMTIQEFKVKHFTTQMRRVINPKNPDNKFLIDDAGNIIASVSHKLVDTLPMCMVEATDDETGRIFWCLCNIKQSGTVDMEL